MQALGAVTFSDLNLGGQELVYKFEVWDGAAWVDLCALGGVNYLVDKTLSFQLGGAGVSPDPIAGTWSAEISNDDGIFHPRHPTSIYSSLLQCGRKVRISIGAAYGGTDYFWPRLVGWMDAPRFDNTNRRVSLSGGDSMKALADTLLRSPNNYWGASATFSSQATVEVLGAEQYTHADAMRISSEYNSMAGWTAEDPAYLTSETEGGGGSTYVAQLYKPISIYGHSAYIDGIGTLTAGKVYRVTFKYCLYAGAGTPTVNVRLYASGASTNLMGGVNGLNSWDWTTVSFLVTANASAARVYIEAYDITTASCGFQMDVLSIKEVTSHTNAKYSLPAGCNGPYLVTLDGASIFFNDPPEKYGWLYDETSRVLEFVEGATIAAGASNLVVYYFTTQDILDVLGDVLAATPLYANRAAALAALSYADPGVDIDKVWFEAGTPALAAAAKICERCGYRFWFDESDVPHFQPAPTHGDAVAWLTGRTFSDGSDFQDVEEIRNSIVIEGIEQGTFSTAKDKKTSRLTGAANDGPFSADKLERTYSTTNDLFQTQAECDAAAAARLAEFKDPKLYTDLRVAGNPIPLQRGDTVEWDIELRVPDGGGVDAGLYNTVRGIVRDAAFSGEDFNYKIEMRSTAMNVANYTTTPVVVTAEHCKGWTLTNAGAVADVHFDLPAATVGMEITFHVRAAYTITVDPNGTDRIAVLTGTNGDYLRSDAVVGSYLKLVCLAANVWSKSDISGTWTEE